MTEAACHPAYTPRTPLVQTGGRDPARRDLRRVVLSGGVVLAVLAAPTAARTEALSRMPGEAQAGTQTGEAMEADPAGAVWTGLLEACLSMMDRRVLVPSLGKGWRPQGFGTEIGKDERLRDYTHRPTGALAQLRHDRAARRVSFCGTSIFRHFPASRVRAATEGWAGAQIEAGRLTDTGREPGLSRDLDPVDGMVWTYEWCGPKGGAAKVRLEMSEFPPARMDIYRIDDCAEEG